MKPRILFVDDEEHLLAGLRRLLRTKRSAWDMAFVSDARQALALMEQNPFAVVVSDMRMPGMDGAELLTQVGARHPKSTRIILSGYSEAESVLKVIGPAHQFLAKPCDGAVLIRTIESALSLRALFDSEPLQAIVAGLKTLPTPPAIYGEFLAELESMDATAASVAAVLERDVAMAAEILKISNSAFFAMPRTATSLADSVAMLGFNTIRELVTVCGIFRKLERHPRLEQTLERINRHAMRTVAIAKTIASDLRLDADAARQVASAALLAKIGCLILETEMPDKCDHARALTDAYPMSVDEVERWLLGATHGEVGAYLVGLWGFEQTVVESIAYHLVPARAPGGAGAVLSVLHGAEALVSGQERSSGEAPLHGALALDMDFLTAQGYADRVTAWRSAAAA